MRSPRSTVFALCALLALSACAPRQDPDVERAREANELARDLMSPYCPGRTLADCGSPDAAVVREEIRKALGAGESPESVRARIETRFGDRVVGVPRERTGWLLPIAALVAGAGVLALDLGWNGRAGRGDRRHTPHAAAWRRSREARGGCHALVRPDADRCRR